MIRMLLPAFLLLGGFATLDSRAGDDTPKWKRYTSREGYFAAQWPDRPRSESKTLYTRSGRIKMFTESVSLKNGPILSITFSEYPRSMKSRDPRKLLEAVRDGMTADDSSELLTDGSVGNLSDSLRQYPSREFIYQHGKVQSRTILILRDTRLYQITITGKSDEVRSKLAEQFVISFELKK